MTETAKERTYREALEKTRDRLDSFEELYANKEVYYAFDELLGLVEKGLKQGSKIPVTTDKLSVEKLQEHLNTTKKALTEIAGGHTVEDAIFNHQLIASEALAAIGNEGSGDE